MTRAKIKHIRQLAGAALPQLTTDEARFLREYNYDPDCPLIILRPDDRIREIVRGIGKKLPDIRVIYLSHKAPVI